MRNALAPVGLVALGAVLAMGLGAAQQPATARTGRGWEYGKLYITDGTAVLETQTTVCKVELPLAPPDGTAIYRGPKGLFENRWNAQLYAINVFGADGWEILPGANLKPDQPSFVRRQR